MNAARAEDQEQAPGQPVLPVFPGAVTFVDRGHEGATIGVPVTLPGPANGVASVPCDHPDCNGD